MAELNELLRTGAMRLQEVFRELLRENARTIEPLHYLTKNLPFPTIPQETSSRLRTVNIHVAASAAQTDVGEVPTVVTYAEIRGDYLRDSLRNLAAASVSTARKTSPDTIYKQGTNGIGTYATGLEGICVAEYGNICPIFPREDWGRVCIQTCRSSLNEFARTLLELNTHIKNHMITDCYLAFEIIETVSNLARRLESQVGELKQPVLEALFPIRETAKASLPKLLEDTKNKTGSLLSLPPDASAVPVTTETMIKLQSLSAYLSPLASIMTSIGDGGWSTSSPAGSTTSLPSSKSFDVGADGRKLFANYATDMLETLVHTLDTKSRAMMKSRSAAGVFMGNNIAIIDRMIRSSELAPLLGELEAKIDGLRKKSNALYLEAWKEPSAFLLDVQYTNRGSNRVSGGGVDSVAIVKSLSSKDKDAIKEKFKNFNLSFDELIQKHKSYRMEKEVKMHLGREVQRTIEPLYNRFWERYHEIDKGKGKYVKYDKRQMASELASLAMM
ncbi:hypothetical protein LTS18_012388 [Coniosporium uncinatum]|uniref:Uncharacterized protein n=1 Tax=Coniosporium uncinatum TaxID=93489 RepID=A0ACC3DJF2_9PEZI|nr:hypothetical protein LTS18_012388 [Coniosporium uncinatum]